MAHSESRRARRTETPRSDRALAGTAAQDPPRAARNFLLAALILGAALAACAPVFRAGFIYDDDTTVTDNALVHAPDGLWRFWVSKATPDYFPLTSSVFWIEWHLWGDNPLGYHLVNVLLDAAGAILLWRVLLRLRVPGAWLAGLLFVLHPVAVASVAWITELKNTLSLPLFLGSILAWLTFEDIPPLPSIGNSSAVALAKADRQLVRRSFSEGGSAIGNYSLSLALFLLALLAKTSVVMLPAVLLMCAWWRRGKVAGRDWLRVFPFAAVAAAMALVTVWYQYHNAIGDEVVRSDGLAARTACAGWALWFYLYKALLPVNLCAVYPRWTTSASLLAFVPGLLFLAMLLVFARHRKGWGRPLIFSLGCFVAMLAPVLGFFNIYFMRYSLVADQWEYAALVGIVALVAGLLGWVMEHGRVLRTIAIAAAGALILAGGILTFRQAVIYQDSEKLWRDTLEKDPKAWLASDNMTIVFIRKAQAHGANSLPLLAEAERYNDATLREMDRENVPRPFYAMTYYNSGLIHEAEKRYADAIGDYSRTIALEPYFADAYVNRAKIYALLKRNDEAVKDYDKVIALWPHDAWAHFTRGNFYEAEKHYTEAIRDYDEAIVLKPDYAEAYYDRGNVHAAEDLCAEAIRDYDQAIALKGDYVEAYLNRAVTYYRLKDYPRAAADVRAAERFGGHPNPEFLQLLGEAAGRSSPSLFPGQ